MFALGSRHRALVVVILCFAAMVVVGVGLGWLGWLSSWIGTLFKAASGGALGYGVSRYVVKLDLSAVPADQRPVAAISQAILIAGFAVAIAFGV